jgi:fructose-bisphosphate aldolase, class I
MSDRVTEILSGYRSENPGVIAKMAWMLNHGRLGGTGKMVILPVDQGFEHGPGRSFAANPAGYDPFYHAQLAVDAGCNAYAAPLGFLEAVAADYAWKVPLILKLNSHDVLYDERDPMPALTATVSDARRLGCAAIGYTIYPGTKDRRLLYEQLRELTREAKEAGMAVVVWAYPRGGSLSSEGETALDVITYGAQIAAQMGANIIKVKLPSAHLELDAARKVYVKNDIPTEPLAKRVEHVIQSAFNGRRIVIFSGGAAKGDDEVFDEIRAIRDGGGFGSIIGRNSFQRPKEEAVRFLHTIMDIYAGKID